MNLYDLKGGDKVRTIDGGIVEILVPTEDGQWIRARYIEVVDVTCPPQAKPTRVRAFPLVDLHPGF